MSHKEIVDRVEYLQELRRMDEELQKEMEVVQNEIKAHMEAHDLSELTAGAFKVTWQMVVSRRIDGKALARDYPELVERYTRSVGARRFQVR